MSAARILVVDDSLTIRRALEFVLRPQGYTLEFAADGRDALSRAASFVPDLVLLDYVLPDMRGPDVCAALAVSPATAKTPIILVSAKGASIRQAYQDAQNVVSYITKPFKAEVVVAVVANALARTAARGEAAPDERVATSAVADGDAGASPPHASERRDAPATLEETFGELLRQLEDAIAADATQGVDRRSGGRAELLSRLAPGLAQATHRMDDLAQHLAGGTLAPYRLRADGSFASIAATLLDAHRSLCEAAIALAATGVPQTQPRVTAHLVIACPEDHPLHAALSDALAMAPELTAVFLTSEYGSLPALARLLEPGCLIVAPGADAQLDEALRRLPDLSLGATRLIVLDGPGGGEPGLAQAERLEEAEAVQRLIGELAGEATGAPAPALEMGLEIVTV